MEGPFFYWYAVVPRGSLSQDPKNPYPVGISSSQLLPLRIDDLEAVVSSIAVRRLDPEPSLIISHEQVVDWLLEATTFRVLPFRFGTIMANVEEVIETLRTHSGSWTKVLNRVAGCVEMSLKVLWTPPSLSVEIPPLPSPYLSKRAQERAQQEALTSTAKVIVETIHRRLGPLYIRNRGTLLEQPRLLMTGAYLVEERVISAFRDTVRKLIEEFPEYHWMCSGPWPPYHFVSEGDAE